MNQETLAGGSGNPVIDGDLVHPVGCSGTKHAVQAPSGSLRTQPQDGIPHPADASRPMQSHDQEAPEHDLSRMKATHDSHDPTYGRDTGPSIAKARQHPQITRASTLKSHTHMQQVARCAHVHIGGGADGPG